MTKLNFSISTFDVKSNYIAGEWVVGLGGEFKSTNPSNGQTNTVLTAANLTQVEMAISSANVAFKSELWQNMLAYQRAQILRRVANLIRDYRDELALLQTKDNGKPLYETSLLVDSAAGTADYYASVAETQEGAITTPRIPHIMTLSLFEPLGVIGAISPWNSPIASEMQKIAPAIASGNAVILKPAENTSLIAIALAKIFEEAGLPKGILNIVLGKGSIVGNLIVEHPLIKKVTFTGGTSTGLKLAQIAAKKLMPISLELGGKSPTIVLADADIDKAAKGVAFGIFSSAGQACIAGSRLFVHQTIYREFMDRLVQYTAQIKVGDPCDLSTHIGPVISYDQREIILAYINNAVRDGGRILIGGNALEGDCYDGGAYMQPTILVDVPHEHETCQEEIFGPVLLAYSFNDEKELVHLANDNQYGLAAGIWTKNTAYAIRLAKTIDAGTIWINTYKKFSISTPFGGNKMSGIGREKGISGLLAYMKQKSLYINEQDDAIEWVNPRQ